MLALFATVGSGVAVPTLLVAEPALLTTEPARRADVRLPDGVAGGISVSVMAGDVPLLEAALLVARVVRVVDMAREGGCNEGDLSMECEWMSRLLRS